MSQTNGKRLMMLFRLEQSSSRHSHILPFLFFSNEDDSCSFNKTNGISITALLLRDFFSRGKNLI